MSKYQWVGIAVLLTFFGPAFAWAGGLPSQKIILNSLDTPTQLTAKGWTTERVADDGEPGSHEVLGGSAVRISGDVTTRRGKSFATLYGPLKKPATTLGLSVMLEADSNLYEVGLQVWDAEGEALIKTVSADFKGWKALEIDVTGEGFKQAWAQKDKNGKVDHPIGRVDVVWYNAQQGPTSLTIDGLVGQLQAETKGGAGVVPSVVMVQGTDPSEAFRAQLILNNYTAKDVEASVKYRLQRDPDLLATPAPHPVLGRDHAVEGTSWTELDGQRVAENTLTDGDPTTSHKTKWNTNATEVFQTIDLGQARKITQLSQKSGDANWLWKVDIATSMEGRNYTPIDGLQGYDVRKKWGTTDYPMAGPVSARYIRFRYHHGGQPMNSTGMPSSIFVYDGTDDEQLVLPELGDVLAEGVETISVPAYSYAVRGIDLGDNPGSGAYLMGVRTDAAGNVTVSWDHHFVMPKPMQGSIDGPVGMNASRPELADYNHGLGLGAVRFENMKWPMTMVEPGRYAFDGSVGPWHMDIDGFVGTYHEKGIDVLPYLFEVPEHYGTAPPGTKRRVHCYPPSDFNDYAEWVFQVVARYGSTEHPSDVLLTDDKKSGLGWIRTFELWNEPNLNNPHWGHFIGPISEYCEMFRLGAEAVRRADPRARVSNAGFAGMSLDTVNILKDHVYADGKRPVDFIDVLNVHYYSGQVPPEISVVDTNVNRGGAGGSTNDTFFEHSIKLGKWRDKYLPGKPMWLTETGYDTGGHMQVSERIQAAYVARVCLVAYSGGFDRVFLYRERGSTPTYYGASGLLNNDNSRKPSWYTYATMIRMLSNEPTDIQRLPHPDPNVWMMTWRADGEPVLATWAIENQATLGVDLGQVEFVDSFGSAYEQSLDSSFALGEFPIYIKGLSASQLANLFP